MPPVHAYRVVPQVTDGLMKQMLCSAVLGVLYSAGKLQLADGFNSVLPLGHVAEFDASELELLLIPLCTATFFEMQQTSL